MAAWTVRVLCEDGFRIEATVVAGSEKEAWAQGAGLARITGRTSVVEFADRIDEPALFDEVA